MHVTAANIVFKNFVSVLFPRNFTAREEHLIPIMGGPQNWSEHGGGEEKNSYINWNQTLVIQPVAQLLYRLSYPSSLQK
jgi:hypothetical protein